MLPGRLPPNPCERSGRYLGKSATRRFSPPLSYRPAMPGGTALDAPSEASPPGCGAESEFWTDRDMGHRKTLNEKQLAILRWIADGCPEGVMKDYSHRISAAALRARGLVRVSGRGATWTATVTAAGREYLERAAGPSPPVPRQANASVTKQLVDDVIAAGGSLRVPRKRYSARGLSSCASACSQDPSGARRRGRAARVRGGDRVPW